MSGNHVIKYEYRDGKKLRYPECWCGIEISGYEWLFQDAQHVALSASWSGIKACPECVQAIVTELQVRLPDPREQEYRDDKILDGLTARYDK